MAETGPFEAFYASPLQHPGLLWLAAVVALGAVLGRRGLAPSLRRYLVFLVALSLVDAWLTSGHVYGIGTLGPRAASLAPLGFVLAGDFRYLLLVTAGTPDGRLAPAARSLAAALGLTLVVPLLSQALLSLLPAGSSTPRVLFLIYEVAFVLLVLALLRLHPRLASGWLRGVSRFVLVYYALWATADAILLATGSDLGYALRVVPNVLYYGGLIATVALLAPSRFRDAA